MKKTENVKPEIILHEFTGRKNVLSEHQRNCFIHMLCQSGSARLEIGNKNFDIGLNDIAILLPSSEFKITYSRNFKASYLAIGFDLMSKNNPDIGWGIKGFLFSKENPVVKLSELDAAKCLHNFELLQQKSEDIDHRFCKEVVNLQLRMFILDMWNIFSKEMEKRSVSNQKGSLFERFLQLVEEHCMEEREVEFYASELFITAKYLTEISKKNSGKTASEWIQNYTTQRLIMLLQNNDLSFTQIADILNFSSQTFFSRYVRKVLNMTPGEYRRRISIGKG